jgi:hypothetical protein
MNEKLKDRNILPIEGMYARANLPGIIRSHFGNGQIRQESSERKLSLE